MKENNDNPLDLENKLYTIEEFGEASLMVFNGNYSHAVLKKAKL